MGCSIEYLLTTAKYTHCDVCDVNVYRAIKRGSAQNCKMTVDITRLSIISLKYAVATMFVIPITEEGMVRRVVSVVEKPRLRSDSVRYVCGGPTGTFRVSEITEYE